MAEHEPIVGFWSSGKVLPEAESFLAFVCQIKQANLPPFGHSTNLCIWQCCIVKSVLYEFLFFFVKILQFVSLYCLSLLPAFPLAQLLFTGMLFLPKNIYGNIVLCF